MEKPARELWGFGRAFFSRAPENGGLAYVVIQHLSPDHKSLAYWPSGSGITSGLAKITQKRLVSWLQAPVAHRLLARHIQGPE